MNALFSRLKQLVCKMYNVMKKLSDMGEMLWIYLAFKVDKKALVKVSSSSYQQISYVA